MLGKAKRFVIAHKVWSALIFVAVAGTGYWGYQTFLKPAAPTQYVLGTVTKGTVVSSVSASGQVSASDQVNLTAQESGAITWVGVAAGDTVYAGQPLISIDDTTAQQNIASAEANLKTAELQYQQDQTQAPLTYQSDLANLQTAEDDLTTAYANTFNDISTAYLDLPNVMTGANTILFGYDLNRSSGQWNVDYLTNIFLNQDRETIQPFADRAKADYEAASAKYEPSLLDYQRLARTATTTQIDTMLAESIDTETAVAQALQSELNFLGKVIDLATTDNFRLPSAVTTLQTNATNYLATVNGDLNALLSVKRTIDTDQQTIINDRNAITLLRIGNDETGTNPVSLQISAAQIEQQKASLANLKTDLAKYTVRAPFSGTIASVAAHVGDQASGTLGVIVTNDRIATLSLNEVDAAKIALGDKATLTFDAIDGLTLTGTVVEIDPVGTVSQGVVTYDIQIDFSTQDKRVKPGMTVNAAIQTAVAQGVLIVPASAVTTVNGQSYVQTVPSLPAGTASSTATVSGVTPVPAPVVTGISDDTNVAITSGLSEGQLIVVRTASGTDTLSAAAAAASRTSGARGGFGGGAVIRGL